MNKIAAITMVKNEADIIESFARHTLTFADILLVADHKSTDDTRNILTKLQDEGLPLKIETVTTDGHIQSEVMTKLMRRAIAEESADIIVALDADEFLLHEKGGSTLLRQTLQELATDKVYYVRWFNCDLVKPEECSEKYLLSRPCRIDKKEKLLPKVIVGATIAQEKRLCILQGNHYAEPEKDFAEKGKFYVNDVAATKLPDVYYAHFPCRSKAQLASKSLCMWLTNAVRYSKYAYVAQSYRDYFDDFVQGCDDPEINFGDALIEPQPLDTTAYADECKLCYTKKAVNPVANALRLAESIAVSLNETQVLNKCTKVSYIVVYQGEIAPFRASLESVVRDTYPYREIFVAMQSDNAMQEMVEVCRGVGVPLEVVAGDITAGLQQKVKGEYVKWIMPGDVLTAGGVTETVILLESTEWATFVIHVSPRKTTERYLNTVDFCPTPYSMDGKRNFCYDKGNDFMQKFLSAVYRIDGGLTAFFFRRSTMESNDYLREYWKFGTALAASVLINIVQARSLIATMEGDWFKSAEKEESADSFIRYNLEWQYCLRQAFDNSKLWSQQYRGAMKAFFAERDRMKDKLAPTATPKFLSAYMAVK